MSIIGVMLMVDSAPLPPPTFIAIVYISFITRDNFL